MSVDYVGRLDFLHHFVEEAKESVHGQLLAEHHQTWIQSRRGKVGCG